MKKLLLIGAIVIIMLGNVFSQNQPSLPDSGASTAPIQSVSGTPDALAASDSTAMYDFPGKEPNQIRAGNTFEYVKSRGESNSDVKGSDPSDSVRNKTELYAGYSGASLYSNVFEPIENGFNLSGVYYFHKYIGAKVDFSGTYKKFGSGLSSGDHSLYNLTGGVQLKDTSKDPVLKPFVHLMFGVGNHRDKYQSVAGQPFNFDFTGFSTVVGGGLDIKVHRRIDIRAIQADVNPIFYKQGNGAESNYTNIRFGAGIVFNF